MSRILSHYTQRTELIFFLDFSVLIYSYRCDEAKTKVKNCVRPPVRNDVPISEQIITIKELILVI